MNRKGGFIFTSKRHPEKGIMASILGMISILSLMAAVYFTTVNKGEARPQYGAVGLIVTLFSLGGMILGIMAAMEKEKFRLFPVLGIVLNLVALAMISMILYAGAYSI